MTATAATTAIKATDTKATDTKTMDAKVAGVMRRDVYGDVYGDAYDTYDTYGTPRAYDTDRGAAAPVGGATRFGRQVAYLLSGLPLGIAAFALTLTGFCLGVPTLILLLGVPVLGGTLAVARYFARVEAAGIARATGRPLPPEPARVRRGGWGMLADAQGWRDLAHAIVAFPVRVATFAITLVWLAGSLGGITYGLWSWSVPRGDTDGWVELAFGWTGTGADIAGNTVGGVVLLLTAVPVVRGLTLAQAGLGRVLLRGGVL